MTDKKWGSTVLGWFIVQDQPQSAVGEEAPAQTDEEALIAKYAADDAAASEGDSAADPAASFKGNLPPVKEGAVDFPAVFEAAGIDGEEQSRIARATDLLASLPAGTDENVKKQIVQASLKAFGVPIEKIIEAGVGEIQALEGYIRAGSSDTEKVVSESEKRIQQYEEEIRQLRVVMQQRVAEQQTVIKSCNEKKLQIQSILEFFGREEVERVVKASPRLVDPSTPTTT